VSREQDLLCDAPSFFFFLDQAKVFPSHCDCLQFAGAHVQWLAGLDHKSQQILVAFSTIKGAADVPVGCMKNFH